MVQVAQEPIDTGGVVTISTGVEAGDGADAGEFVTRAEAGAGGSEVGVTSTETGLRTGE